MRGYMVPDWVLQILLLGVGIIGSGTVYYYLSQKRPIAALWAGCIGVIVLVICVTLYLHNGIVARRTRVDAAVFHGRITAGTEHTPLVPPGTFSMMLGDDLQVLTRASEQFIFSKDDKPFLKLRTAGAALYVSASVVDERGQDVVRIIDNEFSASAERAFNPKQPDDHTLIVRDFDGNEVLNVRYMNDRAIRLTGRFYLPGYSQPVEVLAQDGVRFPGGGGIGHMTVDMTAGSGGFIAF